jgi:hypothetical protein
MRNAPYHRSYERTPRTTDSHAGRYVSNPACHFTDQGADADPTDLKWQIHRRWRVIYYTYRHAAGLPLWDGVDDFIVLMADVLSRLSRGFEPIAPIHSPPPGRRERDRRAERVYQSSCRVYPWPVIEDPEESD